MVMASHCAHTLGAPANFGAPPFGMLFQFGRSGADLFFVLSGFLISFIHWKDIGHPERLSHYLARRITRIYPTYWLVLLLIVPVDAVTHTLYDQYGNPLELIENILLLPQSDPLIDVTWSLRNEVVFYSLFGLLIFNRTAGMAIAAIWIAMLVISPLIKTNIDNTLVNLLTYPMNFEFIAGVVAGWVIQRRSIPLPGVMLGVGLIIFTAFSWAENARMLWTYERHLWYPGHAWSIVLVRSAGYGLAAVLIITGLATLEMRRKIRAPAALIVLGDASYILYLIHIPALLIFGAIERHLHLLRFVPAWLLAGFFMLSIVVGAVLLNIVVEKPLLRHLRRLPVLGRRQANAAT